MQNKLVVEIVSYDDLEEEEKEGVSNNGSGKEYASYIRVIHDGSILFVESDAMEPEDAKFGRDLNWIVNALNTCYKLGQNDSK